MSRCDGCERDTQTIAGRCANCGAVKVPAVAPRATLPKPKRQLPIEGIVIAVLVILVILAVLVSPARLI